MWPFPKRYDFYQMLSAQAAKVEEGMLALHEFMEAPADDKNRRVDDKGRRVEEIEKEADELRRVLIDGLNRTFVTPMDREDIFALSRTIDDVCDYARSTVAEMLLFEVKPNDHLKKMAEILLAASGDVSAAVGFMKSDPKAAIDHVVRAKKAENHMEHRYREALAELFKTNDVIAILKLREIYRHMSNAADRCDEAADIIGDILVKSV